MHINGNTRRFGDGDFYWYYCGRLAGLSDMEEIRQAKVPAGVILIVLLLNCFPSRSFRGSKIHNHFAWMHLPLKDMVIELAF